MIAIEKPATFIDYFRVKLASCTRNYLTAILRDETGDECARLETVLKSDSTELTWKNLNHLPYGIYTLVLSQGDEEVCLKMVKRI